MALVSAGGAGNFLGRAAFSGVTFESAEVTLRGLATGSSCGGLRGVHGLATGSSRARFASGWWGLQRPQGRWEIAWLDSISVVQSSLQHVSHLDRRAKGKYIATLTRYWRNSAGQAASVEMNRQSTFQAETLLQDWKGKGKTPELKDGEEEKKDSWKVIGETRWVGKIKHWSRKWTTGEREERGDLEEVICSYSLLLENEAAALIGT
ncbi:uncharacterized protein LOC132402353 [Hypanus sabinus]|uniref:uncharacterized protein LOC132402353 n=1 Tax=Hypanus sabinus TaxID=79690 RepID=UPI0028C41943|nr:uncharacterized protein LOC132402353 [Hypanus sabinus]